MKSVLSVISAIFIMSALAAPPQSLPQQVLQALDDSMIDFSFWAGNLEALVETAAEVSEQASALSKESTEQDIADARREWDELAANGNGTLESFFESEENLRNAVEGKQNDIKERQDIVASWIGANDVLATLLSEDVRLRNMLARFQSGAPLATKNWCMENLVVSESYDSWNPDTFAKFVCTCESSYPRDRADNANRRLESIKLFLATATGTAYTPPENIPE